MVYNSCNLSSEKYIVYNYYNLYEQSIDGFTFGKLFKGKKLTK